MTTVRLPIDQTSALFGFSCELEGITYGFTFRWNDREECWHMDLTDGEGNAMVSGIAVRLDVPLLNRFAPVVAGLPPGVLTATDTTGSGAEAAFDDLGRRVVLQYFPLADVLAALAA